MRSIEYQQSDKCQQKADNAGKQNLDIFHPMDGIGKRVKVGRKQAGLTQAQLGERVGLTQSAIAEIESGRSRDTTKIVEIANAIGKSTNWLRNKPEAADSEREFTPAPGAGGIVEIAGTEFARLPVYDIRFAAGAGAHNDDETPIDHYMISMSLLRSCTDAPTTQIAIFQADGDSMEPTINSRDWVFVDRRKSRLTNPGIYALIFEGDGLLKRAAQHLESGAVTLISDNPKYPAQTIKKPERLSVVGRVFLSLRRH